MNNEGSILIKRLSKTNVYVKSTSEGEENSIGNEILKLPNCALEPEKPVKVGDFLLSWCWKILRIRGDVIDVWSVEICEMFDRDLRSFGTNLWCVLEDVYEV